MSISRRKLLAAGAAAPLLSSCATDLSLFSDEPLPALAARLGVCAATYATLEAGRPNTPMAVSGCKSDQPVHAQSIFQAASLTKPVIAFVALKLVRDGGLDLRAPVSRYLPEGYAHRQTRLRLTQDIRGQVVGGTSWLGWGTQHDFLEPNAAASLYTTASDYAKLLAALLAAAALLALTLANPVPTEPALG